MDILFVFIGALCILTGMLGCFLPILPGPPIALLSIIVMKFSSFNQNFSWNWIIIFAAATAVASVLDYIFQIWGTKKFGGTKAGIIGSIVGIIVGIFFMPFGIIVCPFLGAFIGEIIVGRSSKQSLKAALGTFVGFMFGTGLKLLLCVWILIYFILNLLK